MKEQSCIISYVILLVLALMAVLWQTYFFI
jgi:hypothetical protein